MDYLDDYEGGTSGFLDYDYTENHYGEIVAESLICFFGIVFNFVVILLICVLKDYKKTSHWYVLHLAIADGLFLVLLPFDIVQIVRNETWDFGEGLCFVFVAARHICYYVGILLLTVMSFDRYVAIVHPMSSNWRAFRSRKGRYVMTVLVWIVGCGLTAPVLMETTSRPMCYYPKADQWCIDLNIPRYACNKDLHDGFYGIGDEAPAASTPLMETVDSSGNTTDGALTPWKLTTSLDDISHGNLQVEFSAASKMFAHEADADVGIPAPVYPYSYSAWIIGDFVVMFVLPVTCMFVCYGCILWRMHHPRARSSRSSSYRIGRKASTGSSNTPTGLSWGKKDVKVMILVVTLVAAFIVCWLPYNVILLYDVVLDEPAEKKIVTALKMLAFSNTLLNPILYTFLGINFKRRLHMAYVRVMPKSDAREIVTSFKYVRNKNQVVGSQITRTTKGTDSSDANSAGSTNMQMQVLAQVCVEKEDRNMNVYAPCPAPESTDEHEH